ncbi:MAG: helix-turn-helix transcriptional regulator [Gallionella sp.]|nr:helix-turn-helix transcriptional regulator [Gallionella sp.]
MVSIKNELGEVLKNLRLEAGLSQEQLGERCGLKRAYIGIIERGEKAITVETAARLAEGLAIQLSGIFARVERLKQDREKTGGFAKNDNH